MPALYLLGHYSHVPTSMFIAITFTWGNSKKYVRSTGASKRLPKWRGLVTNVGIRSGKDSKI